MSRMILEKMSKKQLSIWGGVALVLLALSGCEQGELRQRVESVETRVNAAAGGPKVQTAAPVSMVPVRRSAVTLDEIQQRFNREISLQSVLNFSATRFETLPGGKVKISVAVPASAAHAPPVEALFKGAGFVRTHTTSIYDILSVEFDESALSVFAKKANSFLDSENLTLSGSGDLPDVLRPAVSTQAENFKPNPGTLAYTAQPLDLALSDTGSPVQELYIEVMYKTGGFAETAYLRGGRLVLGLGNTLSLNGMFLLSVETLPAGTVSVAVDQKGEVFAYDFNGVKKSAGRLDIVRIKSVESSEREPVFKPHGGARVDPLPPEIAAPVIVGHLEIAGTGYDNSAIGDRIRWVHCIKGLLKELEEFKSRRQDTPSSSRPSLPLVFHALVPKTTEHLKLFGVEVELSGDRVVIGKNANAETISYMLAKVLDGLRKRMDVHEENLRNAGKTRDADGHLNAYRRKTVELGKKGEILDGVDTSELPRNYKPGDPDAGPDGFVVLSNVNKTVETAEFKAVIAEYQMVREALMRLDARQIFPEAPRTP